PHSHPGERSMPPQPFDCVCHHVASFSEPDPRAVPTVRRTRNTRRGSSAADYLRQDKAPCGEGGAIRPAVTRGADRRSVTGRAHLAPSSCHSETTCSVKASGTRNVGTSPSGRRVSMADLGTEPQA